VTGAGDTIGMDGTDILHLFANSAMTVSGVGGTVDFLGSASVTAAGGQHTFTVAGATGNGKDTIAGFQTGSDVVQFNSALFADYATLVQHMSQVGANTVIQHDANTSVTLANVDIGTLTASNFNFV
jgi:hypothetical protein